MTLYQLLALSDALITDISSVHIDYLMVNRPIIFSFQDIDEYAKSRTVWLQPLADWLGWRPPTYAVFSLKWKK